MTSSTLTRFQEILEELEEQRRIGERIHADAKAQYEAARARNQAIYARVRAEQARRNKSLFRRIKESVFS